MRLKSGEIKHRRQPPLTGSSSKLISYSRYPQFFISPSNLLLLSSSTLGFSIQSSTSPIHHHFTSIQSNSIRLSIQGDRSTD
ncbi:hypothetical protein L6452_00126 [Arctium lappa]|uniref:Uncharacterized protein n=1 Tax=Arctium lappa TaxID=4217 RepID=A0ACB9FDU0_ARCLA|nr:hypothetical protein L6452_00126 [Arctium lappa]